QIAELDSELKDYESKIKAMVEFNGEFECSAFAIDLDKLFDPRYSALAAMLQKKVKSAGDSVKIANRKTPTLGVDAAYSDELDTRRYMLSLSVPLAFGSGNEAARAAAMHTYAAARNELESFAKEYKEETSSLKARLENYKRNVTVMENSIKISADTLIEQSRMRFKAGEESLISMLKSAETKLQMTETIIDLKKRRHKAVSEYIYRYAIDPKGVTK
ncbi:MAG: TolC family protein, partial [Hydrogenimonas sp.]|nr:TolC family protein [Hydrogenimonas sp.]